MDDLVSKFKEKRILVVGDLMLDEHIRGSLLGGAAESGIAVVWRKEHNQAPGGAANAAANAAGLGGKVVLAGVIGADEAGKRLCRELTSRGIDIDGLFIDSTRPTTSKISVVTTDLRYRLDHEQRTALSPEIEESLWRFIERRLPEVDVCLLSDYAKGVVSPALAARLIEECRNRGLPIVADPKGNAAEESQGATLIKPRIERGSVFLDRWIETREDALEAGRRLMELLGAPVLLTRGRSGMTLFQPGREALHLPSMAQRVIDETGAGDTVAATMALALAAGASLEESALLSSRTAAIVVGYPGTTAVCLEDLAGTDSVWPTVAEEPGYSPVGGQIEEDEEPHRDLVVFKLTSGVTLKPSAREPDPQMNKAENP